MPAPLTGKLRPGLLAPIYCALIPLRSPPSARYYPHAWYASRTNLTSPPSRALVISPGVSSGLESSTPTLKFPLGVTNFRRVRELPGLAYFDKTGYIPKIEGCPESLLFCRPRRFGKSLTISMLQCFHGVEFRSWYDQMFEGLQVHKAVEAGEVTPGEYLVLRFDFSRMNPDSRNSEDPVSHITNVISSSIKAFKENYGEYLGEAPLSCISTTASDQITELDKLFVEVDIQLSKILKRGDEKHPLSKVKGVYLLVDEYDNLANDYMNPHEPKEWATTRSAQALRGFWSVVKGARTMYYGARKLFITGVTPLLLSDLTSAANDHENFSFDLEFSAMYGLTQSDVLLALRTICHGNEMEAQKHLEELTIHANGYHFCGDRKVETVFNTQTAISYLEAVKRGTGTSLKNPRNSEVSKSFLKLCATTNAVTRDMERVLQKDQCNQHRKIPYNTVLHEFGFQTLHTQASGVADVSAWRSLVVYMGGLTFDPEEPSKFLKVPNKIALQRFAEAILSENDSIDSMTSALNSMSKNGDIREVLTAYCRLIRRRDIHRAELLKMEQYHRDNIRYTILENPALTPRAEYRVHKWSNRRGYIDLAIESQDVYIAIEFKTARIDYLGLPSNGEDRAEQLLKMGLDAVLNLKFASFGTSRPGKTIQYWIDGAGREAESGEVRKQLRSYIKGKTMKEKIGTKKNFRAYAVIIVGNRHIIIREMNRDGEWVGEFELV